MATDTPQTDAVVPKMDPAQKYIRTFAQDMEVVQKGGTPDLAPLTETGSVPPISPQQSVSAPVPPLSAVTNPPSSVKTPAKVLDEMSAIAPSVRVSRDDAMRTYGWDIQDQQHTAPPPVVPPTALPTTPPPVPEPVVIRPLASEYDAKIRDETLKRLHAKVAAEQELIKRAPLETPAPLHTYREDFTDRVKNEQASTITVLAAEQDAAPAPMPQTEGESPKQKILLVIVGTVFIIMGAVGSYAAYTWYAASHTPVVLIPTISAPIAIDEQVEISGEGPVLYQAIQQSVADPITHGLVRHLYSTNATTTGRSIFATAGIPAPDIVLRNIVGARSMAGIVFAAKSQSPFFVLSVASYNDTFAGMLSWESTMIRDLEVLYPSYPVDVALATTTDMTVTPKTVATPISTPSFRDETIANHDVRVYRDALGQSILIYGYWNQKTLVIARDSQAFTEILRRLASANPQP